MAVAVDALRLGWKLTSFGVKAPFVALGYAAQGAKVAWQGTKVYLGTLVAATGLDFAQKALPDNNFVSAADSMANTALNVENGVFNYGIKPVATFAWDSLKFGANAFQTIKGFVQGNPATGEAKPEPVALSSAGAAASKPATDIAAPAPRAEKDIHFATDKASLTAASKKQIAELAKEMKAQGTGKHFELDGAADMRGGANAHNLKLSEARAEAVRAELIHDGVRADQLSIKALGAEGPMNKAEFGLHRRVAVVASDAQTLSTEAALGAEQGRRMARMPKIAAGEVETEAKLEPKAALEGKVIEPVKSATETKSSFAQNFETQQAAEAKPPELPKLSSAPETPAKNLSSIPEVGGAPGISPWGVGKAALGFLGRGALRTVTGPIGVVRSLVDPADPIMGDQPLTPAAKLEKAMDLKTGAMSQKQLEEMAGQNPQVAKFLKEHPELSDLSKARDAYAKADDALRAAKGKDTAVTKPLVAEQTATAVNLADAAEAIPPGTRQSFRELIKQTPTVPNNSDYSKLKLAQPLADAPKPAAEPIKIVPVAINTSTPRTLSPSMAN